MGRHDAERISIAVRRVLRTLWASKTHLASSVRLIAERVQVDQDCRRGRATRWRMGYSRHVHGAGGTRTAEGLELEPRLTVRTIRFSSLGIAPVASGTQRGEVERKILQRAEADEDAEPTSV